MCPAVAGTFLAYAIHTSRGTFLRRVCVTASGVFANFGGVPLAFMFIATLGLTGIGTQWLNDLSINLYSHGFTLYSFEGVALVYMYFQIPLMVLVTLPALEGLRSRRGARRRRTSVPTPGSTGATSGSRC